VQKELLSQRKAHKPNAELIKSANSLWSLANKKNITPAERRKHVEALMNIVRGKLQDIVFKHEASRIVQTVSVFMVNTSFQPLMNVCPRVKLIKYGSQKERDAVALELKGKYKELSQNKYAKVCVIPLAFQFCLMRYSHSFSSRN
jgi:pumilio family protein 6